MAVRVTGDEVKKHIETSIDVAVLDTDFIPLATELVDKNLAASGLSAVTLKFVELYLTAHFVALTEERGGMIGDEFGDQSLRLANAYEKGGLSLTRYGQQALALDTTGTLQSVFAPAQKAEFRVV